MAPGADETLTRPALLLATPLPLSSSVPAELVGHRPDVVAVRWMVAGQACGIDVAKAGFYPNINLAASLTQTYRGRRAVQLPDEQGDGYTFGPAISLPIFLRRRRIACAAGRGIGVIRSGGQSLQRNDRRRAQGHRRSGCARAFARYATRCFGPVGRRRAQELRSRQHGLQA